MITALQALKQTNSVVAHRKIEKKLKKRPLDPDVLNRNILKLDERIQRRVSRGRYSCYYRVEDHLEEALVFQLKTQNYEVRTYKRSFFPEHARLSTPVMVLYMLLVFSIVGLPLVILYHQLGRRYGKRNIKVCWRDSRTVRLY